MRHHLFSGKEWLISFLLLLIPNSLKAAPPPQKETNTTPLIRGTPFDNGCQPGIRLWLDGEYLYWWTKNAPLPVPLATSGSLSDSAPTALNQPRTTILYGNSSVENGSLSGFRVAARSWLATNPKYGIEGSGFYFPEKNKTVFSTQSSSVLGIPFNNVARFPLASNHGGWSLASSGETAVLLANSAQAFSGSIEVQSSTQLWEVELNGLFHFFSLPVFRLSALAGVSYTDLSDHLDITYASSSGNIFTKAIMEDQFSTHNEIYAGQLGLRGEWSNRWLFASFIAKLGLGGNVEVSHIKGSFSDPVPMLYYTYGVGNSGGIFAQPTNSGEHRQTQFLIIPSATFRLGLNLHRNFRISAGYDILYLSKVIRPGDQIDHSINETQAGSNGGIAPVLNGPARPQVIMKATNYWAQGINAGIETRF